MFGISCFVGIGSLLYCCCMVGDYGLFGFIEVYCLYQFVLGGFGIGCFDSFGIYVEDCGYVVYVSRYGVLYGLCMKFDQWYCIVEGKYAGSNKC